MDIYLAGLLAGLGLIVAIGAQNAWVLRQGVRAERIGLVVVLCAASDVVLITAGTLGAGELAGRAPWLTTLFTWVGAAYLVVFAVRSLRSAAHSHGAALTDTSHHGGRGLRSTALTTIAFTWLNPHVYLDTMVVLGTLAATHGPTGRWVFAAGASSASVLWFTGLGFGARRLSGPLGRPAVWRWLDGLIGVTMLGIAARLVLTQPR